MKLLEPGTEVDGFVVHECIHAGGMAHIYHAGYANTARDPGFPLAMKIPRMTAGDGAENIVSFEVELTILPTLTGHHAPRFVAAGDLMRLPYLVMEYVEGQTLQHWLDSHQRGDAEQDARDIARIGSALAIAAHSIHQQNVCHLDLKPANVLLRPDGSVVLLDFGLSCHAHYPDLLAEEMRKAVGSPTWIAPEQVVGVRGDLRSDIFAIGVMLYEMATGELPFGSPTTDAGLRQRLWMTPAPPRQHRPDLPEWLQEVILRCLEPEAAQRYPSAAHLAFDLANPEQVPLTERGRRLRGPGLRVHFKRWIKAAGMHYQPSPLPTRQIEEVPILMVAVPHDDVTDATLYSLREAAARSLGIRPGARLACVSVISPSASSASDSERSETTLRRQHLARLKQWATGLDLSRHSASYHVLESSDVAQALVRYAEANRVSMMILGAATHGLQLQRFVATVPMRVARDAPCTVILVKQQLPFEHL
ncbi:MAG: protein kinase [Alicycliphilus sp.]|jgi:serine/threonine protein kinase|uniref:Bifunctional serine/threonine-protein kinase/universal stress protein n=1 Tax=Diaphorobacter limosus TaxID=3036128 RepID=A0ABZ0IY17_9BURK|nr:bifunctional serine/threonine-protein kinase/universal stress protein [Diaphorobacter sp. Y-1]MBP6752175.1 protein kinase [Alicycliphilus sp.]MCA0441830.1 bifunctional serine/threonine-protein kinase/universal stress protein [Pseudomonadota bacterium]MBP7326533.1 protein kinase [Alicycliphilus sp.]WOO30880.1 bifunctional serine/threonine-protein kinase/universal stress protein [Diaphorobacter sp. Y-1]HRM48555.1 bifunctional serine/threonine-protein kinase/universal stress protein [Alicyclip